MSALSTLGDLLLAPVRGIGYVAQALHNPDGVNTTKQQQALFQQLGGQIGTPDQNGITWDDTLNQKQKFQSSIAQLAAMDPKRYGGAALQALEPENPLDDLLKRAQIANALQPKAAEIRELKDGSLIQYNDRTGDVKVLRQAQPRYGIMGQNNAPVPIQSGSQTDQAAPMSMRNNNPGNMRDPQTGNFQQFQTPQDGIEGMRRDLEIKVNGQSGAMKSRFGEGYQPTLQNVISTWAPPEENDTGNYVDFVSKQTGIAPDRPLTTADIDKILPAMTQMEGGTKAAQYFNPSATPQMQVASLPAQSTDASFANMSVAPQGSPLTPQQAQPVQAPQPQFLQDNETGGYVTQGLPTGYAMTATGEAKPIPGTPQSGSSQSDSIINNDNANLTGKAFLDTIQDPDVKNKAQALLDGRAPYPSINSRTPSSIKMALEAAQQADPTYSAATFPIRKSVNEAFSKGPEAKNINAINTIIGHLGNMSQSVDALGNSGYRMVNAVKNSVKSETDDNFSAKVNAFYTDRTAVGSEAAKAYQGAGAVSQSQQEEWQHLLNPNLGPKTLQGNVKEIGSLLMGKIKALNEQYKSAFPDSTKSFISPKNIAALKNMGVDTSEIETPELVADPKKPVNSPTTDNGGWSIKLKGGQ